MVYFYYKYGLHYYLLHIVKYLLRINYSLTSILKRHIFPKAATKEEAAELIKLI